MKVGHVVAELQEHALDDTELTEHLPLSANVWRGLACTALRALRAAMKLDDSQSLAWSVVESLICGG